MQRFAAEVNDRYASLSGPQSKLQNLEKIRKMIARSMKDRAREQGIASEQDRKQIQKI